MLPDLAGLIAALNADEVGFVVIGAIAVGAHGHIRATQDLDIVPQPISENLDRLGNALARVDARAVADPHRAFDAGLRRALQRGKNLTLSTRFGDLDIVQRLPGVPAWSELRATAELTTLADVPLCVCSRAHLIAMKRARASLQDKADLQELEADIE